MRKTGRARGRFQARERRLGCPNYGWAGSHHGPGSRKNGNGGAGAHFVNGAYDGSVDNILGYYGVDTTNHVAWAVVDHNSQFGVLGVPEPSTYGLLGSAGVFLVLRRRRSASANRARKWV